jgi:hypothetical protein
MTPNEKAARIVEHVALHDEMHGYSQEDRYGTGWYETIDVGDNVPVAIHDQYDCSSLVIDAYKSQGIDTGGATYTLDMYKLVDSGNFVCVPIEQMKRGDILNSTLNRHAAMYLGNGELGEALRGDSADGLGGEIGDQDGQEIRITDYYNDGWTACYRCTVQEKEGWIQEDGKWFYYRDNEPVKNEWVKWNGEWYYLNWLGIMLTDRWVQDNGKWYYVKSDGAMARNEPVKWKDGWCWANSCGDVYETQQLAVEDWHIVGT